MQRVTLIRFGDKYEGLVPAGQQVGEGKFVCGVNTYSGEYNHDHFEGVGVMEFGDEDKYFGGYSGGMKDGFGVFLSASGESYFGQFRKGFKEGFGVLEALGERHFTGWAAGKRISSTPLDEANAEHVAVLQGAVEAKARAARALLSAALPLLALLILL